MSWLFLVSGFSFLWACEKKEAFFQSRQLSRFLARIVLEAFEYYFQVMVLCAVYFYGIHHTVFGSEKTIAPFFVLLGAFCFHLIRKNSEYLLWMVFATSFFLLSKGGIRSFPSFLAELGISVLVVSLLTLGLLGLWRRLLLSTIPKGTQGLPIYFICAAVIVLALWGFQGVLPK